MGSAFAAAQDSKKVWTIGILWHAANREQEEPFYSSFLAGLADHGYVDGRNVVLHATYVDENYDLFQVRAQELADKNVDVIMASVPAAAAAARRVSRTIPVVFATSGDPVRLGLVEHASPGQQSDRITLFYPALGAKHLEMLRAIIPRLSRVAILWNSNNEDAAVAC